MKIRVTVHTKAPEVVEIPDEQLEGLSEDVRDEVVSDEANMVANEMIDVGWEIVED